jgi:transposase
MRRLEVFTGAGRHRAWTVEQKAQILAESNESGEKVSTVARRHGLTPQQLFRWRRDARGQALARRRSDEGAVGTGSAFAPVIVEGARPCADASLAPACPSGSAVIEIVIGAATVRVPAGTDAATLRAVLRAVKAAI